MADIFKALIISIIVFVVLAYLVMLGASGVNVSGSLAEEIVTVNVVWEYADSNFSEFKWLPEREVNKKEALGFTDAIRNIIFILSVTALSLLCIPAITGIR